VRIDTIEMADQLDSQGSSHPLTGPEPTVDISARVSRGLSRDWMSREDGEYWQSIHGPKLVKGFLKRLCAKTAGELHILSGNQLHTMGLTGHCQLKGHQFKLVLVNNPKCDRCKQASETSAHDSPKCNRFKQAFETSAHDSPKCNRCKQASETSAHDNPKCDRCKQASETSAHDSPKCDRHKQTSETSAHDSPKCDRCKQASETSAHDNPKCDRHRQTSETSAHDSPKCDRCKQASETSAPS